MKLKKICSVVVAAALTFSLSVTPILADEVSDLKKQKKDTEEQVNSLQTQLNSLPASMHLSYYRKKEIE